MPTIGLAAGARIVHAPGLPSAPAPGACRAALQNCAGHGARFFHAAAARAGARRFNRARAHVPGTEHNSRGGRPRPAHAAEPPGPLHLHVLTALLSEPLIPSCCFLFFVLVLEARWLAQHVIAQLASSMLAYRGMADVRGVLLLFLVSLATGTIAGSTSTRTCFVQVPFYASREISLHAQWRQTLPES